MSKVTIKDVAARADVSISTVSRYLNGNTKIEPLSKMRIEQSIRELNYIPNASARSLKSQSTYVIGIVVSDIANSFFIRVCKAFESIITSYGYNLLICSTYEDQERERKYIKMLSERRVDAMVICPSGKNQDLLRDLHVSGMPIIIVDRDFGESQIDTLAENHEEAAYQLTKKLLDAGHTRIAVLAGMNHSKAAQDRLVGVRRAYEDEGLAFDESYLYENLSEERAAYEAIEKALSQHQPCTAVFALNPKLTRGATVYFIKNHIAVPSMIAFAGITIKDDTKLLPFDFDRAEQDPDKIGLKAGEMIIKYLRDKKTQTGKAIRIIFEQQIIKDGSDGNR